MKRTFTKYPSGYVRANISAFRPTGYWKAIMRWYPEDGSPMQEYEAYTTGYNAEEARLNLREVDLLDDQKEDQISELIPISEEEYEIGYTKVHG